MAVLNSSAANHCAARQQHERPPDRFRAQDGEHDEHRCEGRDLKPQAVLGGYGMGQPSAGETQPCEQRLIFRGRHIYSAMSHKTDVTTRYSNASNPLLTPIAAGVAVAGTFVHSGCSSLRRRPSPRCAACIEDTKLYFTAPLRWDEATGCNSAGRWLRSASRMSKTLRSATISCPLQTQQDRTRTICATLFRWRPWSSVHGPLPRCRTIAVVRGGAGHAGSRRADRHQHHTVQSRRRSESAE